MSTPQWSPGTLYNPGALVTPLTAPPVGTEQPTNNNFDAGDSGWDKGTGWSIVNTDGHFDGDYAAVYPSQSGDHATINDLAVDVTPGLVINAQCMVNTTGNSVSSGGAAVRVYWYDEDDTLLSASEGNIVRGGGNAWYASGVAAVAPAGAATAKFGFNAFRTSGAHNILVDACTWDYAFTTPPTGLIFKAVQTDAGFSANVEPTWPTVLGNTVVDNQVTWEAVLTTRVTYEAHAILVSGSAEPTWPTIIGGNVADNTIIWQAVSGVVSDPKCPNSKPVAIAASKVFAGDVDIIGFSATINPLDWSTADDAGYIPFGLNTYGSQPVAALGLYRSNLVAFNSLGFQMWQVDQDPANMALLDSVPISCTFPRTVQPFANDLIFLNPKGVRNVSIAGASTNLQADGIGQPIDTLVQPKVKAGTYDPIGLYWPFAGQYWLVFGPEAFILTINGVKARSWSRYVLPAAITDWTLDGDDLVLRMGNTILKMDADLTQDDVVDPISTFTAGGAPTGIEIDFIAGTDSGTSIGYGVVALPEFGTLLSAENIPSPWYSQRIYVETFAGETEDLLIIWENQSFGAPAPSQNAFVTVSFEGDSGPVTYDTADAFFGSLGPGTSFWQWTETNPTFTDGNEYVLTFTI